MYTFWSVCCVSFTHFFNFNLCPMKYVLRKFQLSQISSRQIQGIRDINKEYGDIKQINIDFVDLSVM